MSSALLKYLGCFFMLIDHIGICFFPELAIFRIIGRLAFPLFAFQVSIGYKHTSSKSKYFCRMFLFAILSQIPFMLFRKISMLSLLAFNVCVSFLFSIICMKIIDFSKEKRSIWPILIIPIILIIGEIIKVDYSFYGILLVILFYLFDIKKDFVTLFALIFFSTMIYMLSLDISYIQIYSLLAPILLLLFNNEKGKSPKYLFYVFYPLHFIILYLIKLFI